MGQRKRRKWRKSQVKMEKNLRGQQTTKDATPNLGTD
jgi:hypothetical protein